MVFMGSVGVHRRGEVSFERLLSDFRRDLPDDVGGIACFIGVVRGRTGEGRRVRGLSYEAADHVLDQLQKIVLEAESRPGIRKAAVHHIVDGLSPSEDTIYVMVAGRGRDEVFAALREVVDRIKFEAHIWKKEITEDGEHWAHERWQRGQKDS